MIQISKEIDYDIDPELADDRDNSDEEVAVAFDLPEYDPSQFELPDDFEYEEDGDENGDS